MRVDPSLRGSVGEVQLIPQTHPGSMSHPRVDTTISDPFNDSNALTILNTHRLIYGHSLTPNPLIYGITPIYRGYKLLQSPNNVVNMGQHLCPNLNPYISS